MTIREVDTTTFTDQVLNADGPVLVDFHAAWCGPCRAQAPILERFANAAGDRAAVVKVDVDANAELAGRYGVRSIPTLLLFEDGEVRATRVGVTQSADLEALLTPA